MIRDAVHEVLLPFGHQQSHMIDATEVVRRKGHSPPEVARLASEFGRARKTACQQTGRVEALANHHELGGGSNGVRMYHAHVDAFLLDTVYYNFQRRELYQRVCATHGDAHTHLTLKVEEAIQKQRHRRAEGEVAEEGAEGHVRGVKSY